MAVVTRIHQKTIHHVFCQLWSAIFSTRAPKSQFMLGMCYADPFDEIKHTNILNDRLIEKVYVVSSIRETRWRSRAYRFHLCLMLPYIAIFTLMVKYSIDDWQQQKT